MFYALWKTEIIIWATFNLLFADTCNLVNQAISEFVKI